MSYKLLDFSETFSNEIFPLYKHHENTFDSDKMHGVLHIGRSLVAAYVLYSELEKYKLNNQAEPEIPNIKHILMAVSYHDSGRKGNGVDYWESFSSKNCKDAGHEYAGNLIIKNRETIDYNAKIVYDADVLEVMRPCCGHNGIYGFDKKYLLLLETLNNFYSTFINEWWSFILFTESMKDNLSIPNILERLVEIINSNEGKFSLTKSAINN